MNIFVAKLNYSTSEDTLRNAFEEFGTVDSAKIIMDRDTQRSKGFGFVEMANDDEANQAISSLNDTEIDGRTIVVKVANSRD
jgi:RNA recognition motif-containing protein